MGHHEQQWAGTYSVWRGRFLAASIGAFVLCGCAPDLAEESDERWDLNADALVLKPEDRSLWHVEITEDGQTSRRDVSMMITDELLVFFETEVCTTQWGADYGCSELEMPWLSLPISSHSSLKASSDEYCFVSGEGGYRCRYKDELLWYERDYMSLAEELSPTLYGDAMGCEQGAEFELVGDVEIELTTARELETLSFTMKVECARGEPTRTLRVILYERDV